MTNQEIIDVLYRDGYHAAARLLEQYVSDKVYVILHRWEDEDAGGYELSYAYQNKEDAIRKMHELAETERRQVKAEYDMEFNPDFCDECDELVTFGWYGPPFCCDCTWSWSVEELEVNG